MPTGQVGILDQIRDSIDVSLSSVVTNLKPLRSTVTQQLSSQSIAASGTSEITLNNLDGYSAAVVIVKAAYNASATAGVRVRWLYSPDGTTYDSTADAESQGNYEDLSFTAGGTHQRTILVPIFTDNIKIQIVNQDTSYSVTVDAWTLLMR